MEGLRRSLLQRPVHPLDLTVGPWMIGLDQPMLDAMPVTNEIETMGFVGLGPRSLGELHTVIGQYRVDEVR